MILRQTAAVVLVWSTIVACQKERGDSADAASAQSDNPHAVVSVRTAVATLRAVSPTLRAIGTVSPSPGGYAELSAPGPTRVAHVYVAPGDAVHVGAPLVSFDSASLQATAQSATSALNAAQATYNRAVRLSNLGILPRKAVDQAAADLAQAKANNVTAQRANALSTLRAPITGVVTRVSAVQGASVDANAVLVAVADPTRLDVVLSLSPDAAAKIRRGAMVTLRAAETPDASMIGTGAVAGINAALDSATHAVPVRVTLSHTTRPLRVGETVTSDITVSTIPNALMVPTTALVPTGDSVTVFVVDHGVAHAHIVTVGARTDSTAQILSGLNVGQIVVTTGAFGVQDSSQITVTPP
ncbi:MAG TPA: efflux RND transporter periplasmic adaptor subunit [Gemmatimonadaceae bacterium]|nr:efflux RND transporter periplasmic adaptor subunit [Gemmatimonadaceae bacterium]